MNIYIYIKANTISNRYGVYQKTRVNTYSQTK